MEGPLDPAPGRPYTRRMSPDVIEVERALLALPPQERARVAHRALDSLDTDQDASRAEVDAAWVQEIEQRLADVHAGRVELGTFEDTYAAFVNDHPLSR
jgi:putative addiction module component (TIGR02574 family)